MQAVIFAAGKGTRTYPLTLTRPKPLLRIANIPIIEYQLKSLQGIVEEAIIVVGYKKEMIQEHLGESYGDIAITYVVQEKQEGTGSALLAAKDMIKDRFIAMVGDDLYAKSDIQRCMQHQYCILVKKIDDLSRFGEVVTREKRVVEMREKPGHKPGFSSAGLMVLDRKVFEYSIEKSKRGEYELPDFINKLAKDKEIGIEEVQGFWMPISYPWNLIEANSFFLNRIQEQVLGDVEPGAVLKGPVVIGKGTLVKAGAYIEGPVVIGEDCTIGPNCYIRPHTTIGHSSKVGNAVEIKNTIIGDNTSIGHLSYIGDSVIGDYVNLGAGTITANLRHDNNNVKTPVKGTMTDTGRRKLGTIIGDGVHTGIHTSIYPGRKLWPKTETLPGEVVQKDNG